MNEIRKISNSNILFLNNSIVVDSFLASSEVLEGSRPYQITISNTGNNKVYSFDWKAVTILSTPSGSITPPATKDEFIKVLVENFFFIPAGGSGDISNEIQEIIDYLSISQQQSIVNNFYYFQFPFTVNFGVSPSILGNFQFSYFDETTQAVINFSNNLNGQVFTSLQILINLLNSVQTIFVFSIPTDLTQLENYTIGNTTIQIQAGNKAILSYIQNSFVLNTTQGAINGEMYEGYKTPEGIPQKTAIELKVQNDNLVSYLSGANYTTPKTQFTTRAALITDTYLLVGLKATNNVTIILKEAETKSNTLDDSLLTILLNPTFALAPIESLPYQNSYLAILSVSAGTPNPTPQTVTGGTLISLYTSLGNSISRKTVNRKIMLKKNDVIAFVVKAETANLDINGFLSWLE